MKEEVINGSKVQYRFSCDENLPLQLPVLREAEAFRESHSSRVEALPDVVHFISVQVLPSNHRLAVGDHKEPAHLRWMADVRFSKEGLPPHLQRLKVVHSSVANPIGGPFDDADWIYLAPFLHYIEDVTRFILSRYGHQHARVPAELWATEQDCYFNFFSAWAFHSAIDHLPKIGWTKPTLGPQRWVKKL
jgi:hypothetical protein